MTNSYLRMVDAARIVVDEVNVWLEQASLTTELRDQAYSAANSVSLNMAEGMGHPPGGNRLRYLRYSRASAEELNEALFAARREEKLQEAQYWRLHHRLVTIVRMIDSYSAKVRDTPFDQGKRQS